MPEWALFKPEPAYGIYDAQTPQGGMEIYAFDWREGIRDRWTCEYDISADLDRQVLTAIESEGTRTIKWFIPRKDRHNFANSMQSQESIGPLNMKSTWLDSHPENERIGLKPHS
jgi:hypothetical protein